MCLSFKYSDFLHFLHNQFQALLSLEIEVCSSVAKSEGLCQYYGGNHLGSLSSGFFFLHFLAICSPVVPELCSSSAQSSYLFAPHTSAWALVHTQLQDFSPLVNTQSPCRWPSAIGDFSVPGHQPINHQADVTPSNHQFI